MPGIRLCTAALWLCSLVPAAAHQGVVRFGGLPVPGATVTATQGDKRLVTVTDPEGAYAFPDSGGGVWTLRVEMTGFATLEREVSAHAAVEWELKLLPLAEMNAPAAQAPLAAPAVEAPPEEIEAAPSDGFLISGSVNNAAASPFAQPAAFGNFRPGKRSLYSGALGVTFNNSPWDARPYSLTGQHTPRQAYTRAQGTVSFGGPLMIPRLLARNGPELMLNYQWTRNRGATTAADRVPTALERDGKLSQPATDPAGGAPFPGGLIPAGRISPQARALLELYPQANLEAAGRYNLQVPLATASHQDTFQGRASKTVGRKDRIFGEFAWQSARSDNTSLFGFLDATSAALLDSSIHWTRRFTTRTFATLRYQYLRRSTRVTPYFAGRVNVSGLAGIAGNNQEPANWGPPSLVFSSGIATLAGAENSLARNQTSGVSGSIAWSRYSHNLSLGGGYRRQQTNLLAQQNARGAFTFTGAATGVDFAGFLLGIPDTAAIAFGNADKYLRWSSWDAHFTDDWRAGASLTVNAGLRWEYSSPVSELRGRLVNLDIAPGFTAIAPVVAAASPRPLIRADRRGLQPRLGISWRPMPASPLVVRAGYGVYFDTSIYEPIATRMAQQPPLSKSLSAANSPDHPLTLANGFVAAPNVPANTFAVDPGLRVGYLQTWQVSIQRDLPWALVGTLTYLGSKGTRAQQQFLPQTWPSGAAAACPQCPAGYVFLASNGNSTRQSGQLQLRRRLRSGLAGQLGYVFSKSIDNAATGGRGQSAAVIAQDWLNPGGERGLSSFDQRHVLSLEAQFTTGTGLRGGTLLGGWQGALFKDWTFATQVAAAAGLPSSPVWLAAVRGTGVTGSIRPDYTGAPLYNAPAGLFLNPAAVAAPAPDRWGNAGRNSIAGPSQFSLNASLARTLRLNERFSADFRLDSANALNRVTYTRWNTTATSPQFGLPLAANPMRTVQAVMRVRF